MFEEAQITPRIVLETENIETVLALSAKGMGITFFPRMFMSNDQSTQDHRTKFMERARLNPYPLTFRRAHGVLGIGYHKGHYMSRATKEFIRIAKERIPYNPD